MNTTLFTSEYCKGFGIDQALPKVIKFISDNKHLNITQEVLSSIVLLKPIVESPINVIFRKAADDSLVDKLFNLYFIPKNVMSIPELFLAPEFTIDTFELPLNLKNTLSFNDKDKILLNLTPYLKFNNGNYNVMDTNGIHGQIVRGLLVRSYNKNNSIWLGGPLATFIIKLYSLTVSSIIALYFHLSIQEQMEVALPLAYFMTHKLDTDASLFTRCTFLGNHNTLNSAKDKIVDIVGHSNSIGLEEMCTCISEFGPTRLGQFTPHAFYRLMTSAGTDSISTSISMEYPPYFVYQLLAALSNHKTKLSHILKANKTLEESKRFIHDLSISSNFLPELR